MRSECADETNLAVDLNTICSTMLMKYVKSKIKYVRFLLACTKKVYCLIFFNLVKIEEILSGLLFFLGNNFVRSLLVQSFSIIYVEYLSRMDRVYASAADLQSLARDVFFRATAVMVPLPRVPALESDRLHCMQIDGLSPMITNQFGNATDLFSHLFKILEEKKTFFQHSIIKVAYTHEPL